MRHILRHRCKRKLQTALRYDRHVRHGCKSCCLLHLPRCALKNRAVRCVWRAHVNVKTSHECAAESRVLTKHADTHTHTICAVCLSPCNIMFWNLLYHATHHNISYMKWYAFRSAGMEIVLTDGCHFRTSGCLTYYEMGRACAVLEEASSQSILDDRLIIIHTPHAFQLCDVYLLAV